MLLDDDVVVVLTNDTVIGPVGDIRGFNNNAFICGYS